MESQRFCKYFPKFHFRNAIPYELLWIVIVLIITVKFGIVCHIALEKHRTIAAKFFVQCVHRMFACLRNINYRDHLKSFFLSESNFTGHECIAFLARSVLFKWKDYSDSNIIVNAINNIQQYVIKLRLHISFCNWNGNCTYRCTIS